jgi:hypothetical protein
MPYHKDDNCKECRENREELYRREHEFARREELYRERYPTRIIDDGWSRSDRD